MEEDGDVVEDMATEPEIEDDGTSSVDEDIEDDDLIPDDFKESLLTGNGNSDGNREESNNKGGETQEEESDYCETDLELTGYDSQNSDWEENVTEEATSYKKACAKVKAQPMTIVMSGLFGEQGENISELDFAHHIMGDKRLFALAKAMQGNTKIVKLNLSDNAIRGAGLSALVAVMIANDSVKDLDLSMNKLGNQRAGVAASTLARLLESNAPLKRLNLASNGFVAKDAGKLCKGLGSSKKLQELDLSRNFFDEYTGELLGTAIASCSTLESVDLSWNQIRLTGAEAFAQSLGSSTLQTLNLSWNGFGNSGAIAMANMLRANDTLTNLDLGYNRIDEEGCLALCDAVKENKTLKVLSLTHNPVGDEGILAWLATILENEALVSLDLSNVPHSQHAARAVRDLIERSTDHDAQAEILSKEEHKLRKISQEWFSLEKALEVSTEARAKHNETLKSGSWGKLGRTFAMVHFAEEYVAFLLGPSVFNLWKEKIKAANHCFTNEWECFSCMLSDGLCPVTCYGQQQS
eukprot:m.145080 g.145080  ORF g.145080 m.145080 type:complete len:523 (-) comp14936_c0_seq3:1183-2751(-)